MEFELRSILLVVGVVVIAAILIHGLIGIRKANEPVDLSGIDLREEDGDRNSNRDGAGFDRDGVGVARVVSSNDEQQTVPGDDQPLNCAPIIADSTIDGRSDRINFDVALEDSENNVSGQGQLDELIITEPVAPLFDSPIFSEKPASKLAQQELEQLNDDLKPSEPDTVYDAVAEIEPAEMSDAAATDTIVESQTSVEPLDVLVLNVIAGDDNELNGTQLLPILLTLGFKFGDMNIFHRYANSTGHGEILFSLANMVKPGVFDIDNMEQFTTSGVSLFMTLPHTEGNLKTFNVMLNAAAKIAEEFSGQVLDGNRSTLTNQSTRQYVERIREVERKITTK